MIDDTFWPGLIEREDYKRKKQADLISYDWDQLIELYVGPNIYVLIFFKPTEDRERRLIVLNDRIGLARHTVGKGNTVIGIGFVERQPHIVVVCELGYLDATEWSAEDDATAKELKAERNFEARLTRGTATEWEYPAGPAGSSV